MKVSYTHYSLLKKLQITWLFSILEDIIFTIDGSSLKTYGLLLPTRNSNERVGQEYSRETDYSREDQQHMAESNLQHLTTEQTHIYHDVMKKIGDDRGGFCFLDCPGGCGATFLTETIYFGLTTCARRN